jgi:hypothetical protein
LKIGRKTTISFFHKILENTFKNSDLNCLEFGFISNFCEFWFHFFCWNSQTCPLILCVEKKKFSTSAQKRHNYKVYRVADVFSNPKIQFREPETLMNSVRNSTERLA